MANLTVTVTEQILLPNNNLETATNTKVISGVSQVQRRIDTVTSVFSGSGQQILSFVDSESQQVAGSFVRDTVKYIRITNLSTEIACSIYLIQTDEDETLFKLDAGKSLMLPNAYFDSSNTTQYVAGDYVDQLYFSNFTTLDLIMAKADTGSIQLEYLVASS